MRTLKYALVALVVVFASANTTEAGQKDLPLLLFPRFPETWQLSLPVKWGPQRFGDPVTIRYGFLTKEYTFEKGSGDSDVVIVGSGHCREMAPFTPKNLSRQDLETAAALAVKRWNEKAGVRMVQALPGEQIDLLIGAQLRPYKPAWTELKVSSSTEHLGFRTIKKAVICLNPRLNWRLDQEGGSKSPTDDLVYVLMHEVGHVLGLDHTSNVGDIMGFKPTGNRVFTNLIVRSVQFYYGAPP